MAPEQNYMLALRWAFRQDKSVARTLPVDWRGVRVSTGGVSGNRSTHARFDECRLALGQLGLLHDNLDADWSNVHGRSGQSGLVDE